MVTAPRASLEALEEVELEVALCQGWGKGIWTTTTNILSLWGDSQASMSSDSILYIPPFRAVVVYLKSCFGNTNTLHRYIT